MTPTTSTPSSSPATTGPAGAPTKPRSRVSCRIARVRGASAAPRATLAVGAASHDELEERVDLLRDQYAPVTPTDRSASSRSCGPPAAPVRRGPRLRRLPHRRAVRSAHAARLPTSGRTRRVHRPPSCAATGLVDIAAASREAGHPRSSSPARSVRQDHRRRAAALQAALRGALVVTRSQTDHNLQGLPARQGAGIELSGDAATPACSTRCRSPPSRRRTRELYLAELLPMPRPEWETQIRKAVRRACATGARLPPRCWRSRRQRQRRCPRRRRALEVWAETGLGQLSGRLTTVAPRRHGR